mmetsp:Transcript_15621/g.19056  ORF Transcript_15621/g.19056 Transcript_15621/m.19056 type:complete len:558 (-) Transcript_15621:1275-2948(-)
MMEVIHRTEQTEISERAGKDSSVKLNKIKVRFAVSSDRFKKEKLEIAAKLAKIDISFEESEGIDRTCELISKGIKISGTSAALRYIANVKEDSGLYGETCYDSGLVDSWLEFSVFELETPLVWICMADEEQKKVIGVAAAADALKGLKAVNEWLSFRTFLATERVTIADIALFCVLKACVEYELISINEVISMTNFCRWFLTCGTKFNKFEGVLSEIMNCLKGRVGVIPTKSENKQKCIKIQNDLEKDPDKLFVSNFQRDRTRIKELLCLGKNAIGSKQIIIKGWVRSVREAEKGATNFIELNDGSCLNSIQIVATRKKTIGFDQLKKCGGAGASLDIQGEIVASLGKNQAIEVQAEYIQVIGPTYGGQNGEIGAQFYPLAKKFHTPEHLRQNAHLRARSRLGSAVARTRHALAFATHEFFQKRGFLYIHTPLITSADAEGAGEQFTVTTLLPQSDVENKQIKIDYAQDFFGRKCGLTVSGQLNVETHAVALSDCYTFGPTFRAENSHTSRHLAEFWMIEPEVSFANLYDDINLATDYLKYCVAAVLARCDDDLAFF